MKKIIKWLQHVAENIWYEITDYFDALTGESTFTDWRVVLTCVVVFGIIGTVILASLH